MIKNLLLTFLLSFFIFEGFGQLTLPSSPYVQNFDGIASGYPMGWTGRTGATTTTRGTLSTLTTTATAWNVTTGAFKNCASSDGLNSNATVSEQAASIDRALSVRQGGSFGDPGASFELEIANTTGFENFNLSFDNHMLDVQPRSTTWTIQYSIVAAGTSWINLGSYTDPGGFGKTNFTVSIPSNFNNLNHVVYVRIVATSSSTGSGNRDTYGIDDFSLTYSPIAGGCIPPTTQATLFNSSNATLTSMNVAWTRGNGTNVLVVARAGSAVNSGPVNGTSYTANTVFGSGTQIGTGNYVVYDGLSTAPGFSITGLTAGTAYHYAVYEYNLTDHCYLSPALVGNASTLSPPASMYRSAGSGGWNTPSVWESSTDNGMTWLPAVSFPTMADDAINIRSGHAITMSENKSLDQLTIETGGSLEILAGQLTINDGLGAEDLVISGTLINSSSPTTTIAKGSGAVVSVHNGGLFQHNTASNVYPVFTWLSGSTIEIKTVVGGGFASSNLNQSFANFTWNVPGQTSAANLAGNLTTVNGNFTVSATGASNIRLIGNTTTINVGGDLIVNSGAQIDFSQSGSSSFATIDLKGNMVINGNITETSPEAGYGVVRFSSTTAQQTITVGDPDLCITENVSLEINNILGVVLLSNLSLNYDGNIKLVNGTLRTNGNVLTTIAPAAVIGGSASSFICNCDAMGNTLTTGYLVADLAAGNTKVFPIGPTPALYMPATLTGNAGTVSDYYFLRVDPLGTNGVIPTQPTQCIQYQWQIDVGSPASAHNVNLKLQWAVGTEGSNFNPNTNLVIGHWNGVKFDVINNATYNPAEPSATATTAFTSFSPFVVASGFSPLPINLLNFTAAKSRSGVELVWSTANEVNNKYFDLQRSVDGINFVNIATINGKNMEKANYSFTDKSIVSGKYFYRLNQVDFDGSQAYSHVVSVNYTGQNLNVYPTITNDLVKVETSDNNWKFEIFEISGNLKLSGVRNGSENFDFSSYSNGIYFIKLNGDESNTYKIIKY